jgi:electron transfer flavoprotein alpha subunit
MSQGILVFSEQDEGNYELLTKATEFSSRLGEVCVLAFGDREQGTIQSLLQYGAKRILTVPNIDPNRIDAESMRSLKSRKTMDRIFY